MFTFYFCVRVHIPGSSCSLITAIKPEVKEFFHACHVTVLHFTKYLKICLFFENLLLYIVSKP